METIDERSEVYKNIEQLIKDIKMKNSLYDEGKESMFKHLSLMKMKEDPYTLIRRGKDMTKHRNTAIISSVCIIFLVMMGIILVNRV